MMSYDIPKCSFPRYNRMVQKLDFSDQWWMRNYDKDAILDENGVYLTHILTYLLYP